MLLCLVASLIATPLAEATFPGKNGRIAFSSFGRIYTVLPDGSGLRQIRRDLEDEKSDYSPAWSPGGARIATAGQVLDPPYFAGESRHWSGTDLHLFNADGSAFTRLTTPRQHLSAGPAWSPDGSRIAYHSDARGAGSIYTVAPDGSDPRRLLGDENYVANFDAAWSPDGSRIVFAREVDGYGDTDLFTMRPDGSDLRRVLDRPGVDHDPSWSPDGRTIAFSGTGARQGDDTSYWFPGSDIYAVAAAGGEPVQLTHSGRDAAPAWAPDGTAIVFQSERHTPRDRAGADLYLMDQDGSDQRRLTTINCLSCDPDWQRLAPPPPQITPPLDTPPHRGLAVRPPAVVASFASTTRVSLRVQTRLRRPPPRLAMSIANANPFAVIGWVWGAAARHRSAPARRRVNLNGRRFKVDPHGSTTVTLTLPKVLRRLLLRRREVRLTLRARVRDPAGHDRLVSKTAIVRMRR